MNTEDTELIMSALSLILTRSVKPAGTPDEEQSYKAAAAMMAIRLHERSEELVHDRGATHARFGPGLAKIRQCTCTLQHADAACPAHGRHG